MEIDKAIADELIYNWRKPDVDKQARAKFLKDYMAENKITMRGFEQMFKIPKNTLHNWLVYGKITKEQYDTLKRSNVSEKVINDTLKSNKATGDDAVLKIEDNHYKAINQEKREHSRAFECVVDEIIDTLKPWVNHPPKNYNGLALKLARLRDIVIKIERKI